MTAEKKPIKYLTGEALVLREIAIDPDVRLRDIALQIGLTERCVYGHIAALEEAGWFKRVRRGRRTHYEWAYKLPWGDNAERVADELSCWAVK